IEGETSSTDNKTNNEEDDSEKVVLLRQQDNYIAQSNVDDYVHRPSCYNVVNLYQWIQTSNKRRISRKNKNKKDVSSDSEEYSDEEADNDWEDVDLANIKKYQQFMPGHPSHETHEVICNMDKLDNVVPNILGGPMPRSDSGDREFYCMTMLTLFKPWRTGKTLKEEGQTWDQAFLAYRFDERDKKIMNNFNLRYECLDARDDFHSVLKKKNRKFGLYNSNDIETPFSDSDSEDSDNGEYNDLKDDSYEEAGPVHLKTLRDMQEAENIVRKAGWLKKCNGDIPELDTEPIEVDEMSSGEWNSLVKEARALALKKKQANLPNVPGSLNGKEKGKMVEVVDADYFKYNFKAKKELDNKVMQEVATEFKLNKEQLRAFRIIANHSSCIAPEQLKMYLGGMGGTGKSQVIRALITMFEKKKESHRFIVLAPTGTAAALLNGST
ncbi:hypothetical protein M413DRAFT_49950, partial [Hebeloma cylindrosporum]